jgi:hypothetical protein
MTTPDEAGRQFIDVLFAEYQNYSRVLKEKLLPEGMPGRVDDPLAMEKWFKGLSEDERKLVREIVEAVVRETILWILTDFDAPVCNLPGIPETISEFVVYLQTYHDWDEYKNYLPRESVRLNPNGRSGDEDDLLQGLFLERLGGWI